MKYKEPEIEIIIFDKYNVFTTLGLSDQGNSGEDQDGGIIITNPNNGVN